MVLKIKPYNIHSFVEISLNFMQNYALYNFFQVPKYGNKTLNDYAKKFEVAMLLLSDLDYRTTLATSLVRLPCFL